MTNPDDVQDLEQAFIESWTQSEQFYIRYFLWGTPEWYTINGFAPSDFTNLPDFAESVAYQQIRHPFYRELLALIADMRQRGYDSKLRAGQSLDRLMLSRSREHGLRTDQAWLGIHLDLTGSMIVAYRDEAANYIETAMTPVAFNPELERLLTKLLERPID